jgi:hypothetical protein
VRAPPVQLKNPSICIRDLWDMNGTALQLIRVQDMFKTHLSQVDHHGLEIASVRRPPINKEIHDLAALLIEVNLIFKVTHKHVWVPKLVHCGLTKRQVALHFPQQPLQKETSNTVSMWGFIDWSNVS